MSLQIETQPFQFNNIVTGLSSATFNSVSASALSGTFYGDGSKLSGVSNYNGSDIKALTGNWQSTYTTVSSNSANWNSAYNTSTTYQTASSTFATNTLLQSTSALLTPLTTTNSLTAQLVKTTDLNTLSATLLTRTDYSTSSATFLTIVSAASLYQNISATPHAFVPSTSSINTLVGSNSATGIFSEVLGGVCNLASGNYSTLVNGFSSCATGYATFVGAGSGIRATGNYAVAVGGQCNTASGNYSTVDGGQCNCATQCYSTASGGYKNCVATRWGVIGGGHSNCTTGFQFTTIAGGRANSASGTYDFIGGGYASKTAGNSVVTGGYNNCACGGFASIVGGRCNTSSGCYTNIGGGLGNYNPLRDSQIVGGVANHTGGYAPFNITAAASISGNGSQTCLIGTGIQSCFSYPFTSGNVSVYYATANNPLSAGTFSTATIAATGTNYIIINGDYSTCTGTSLSATSIYVYDRAINNTGYDNFIGGGKLNTASGCYASVVGGICNFARCRTDFIGGGNNNCTNPDACGGNTVVGGNNNCAGGANGFAFVGGGTSNTASGYRSVVTGGRTNSATSYGSTVAGGRFNCASGQVSTVTGGESNWVCGQWSFIGSGCCNNISSNFSTIVGGKFNYNPLFNSDIHGGSFNHTGGYAPANITFGANLSGNGSCTVLCSTGIGSCFSNSGTTGAVSLMWMTSGTANSTLSSACFVTANVVTNATNCIIVNGDYSACTTGLSACSVYVYDRCVNVGGCNAFIGGGILNTASNCYSFIGGGICNRNTGGYSTLGGGLQNNALGSVATIGGGRNNTTCSAYTTIAGGRNGIASGQGSTVGGGINNTASGYCATVAGGSFNCVCNSVYVNPNGSIIGGGQLNCTSGFMTFIGGGCTNNISGNTYSVIAGGQSNIISSNHSFVAGGSANDTKGFANTFILGTALSATKANYTYVNNLSVQGNIESNTNYVVTLSLTANQTLPSNTDTVLTLDPRNDPNNWFNRTAGTGLTARRITPTVPGYYHIDYQVSWQPGVSAIGAQNNIQVMKVTGGVVNAISIVQQPIMTTSVNTTQNTSVITYMNGSTDYLYFQAYSSNASQVVTGTADGNWTKVEVFKIN